MKPNVNFALPIDSSKTHAALVDLFGALSMATRDATLTRTKQLIEDSDSRSKLGSIPRAPFEVAAALTAEQQVAVHELVEKNIDNFAYRFLMLFAGRNFDLQIADKKVLRAKIVLEVCDAESEEVILEETINRGGSYFPEYWAKWKNDPSLKKIVESL